MHKNIICGIYCIENKSTHKKYIGQSKQVLSRWLKHKSELRNQTHENDYLQKAWNKYGEEDFDFYILEECNESELDSKEIYYIDKYNTTDRSKGYNLKEGGQFHCSGVTEEYSEKLSIAIKESYKNPELIEKRKQDALKNWVNPEFREKHMGVNNGMYGKHRSDELKHRLSELHKGVPSPRRNKTPVLCVELNKIFEDATTAGQELGFNGTGILQVCYGNRKTTHGYHWKFVIEE